MKILCLVLDSDPPVEAWRETYDSHRRVWRRYLDICSSIDSYFVRSDPNAAVEIEVRDRSFTVRQAECFGTVLHKITRAIEVLLDDHDYVIQTGLSSLYDFNLLGRRPAQEGVYSGHLVDGCYPSGAGILMSSDVARLLIQPHEQPSSGWQDIDIQRILQARGVLPTHDEMFIFDYAKGLEQLEVGKHLCYRFRDYGDPRREREREALRVAFERIYENSQ